MAEDLERNGDKAIVDEDYDQAVTLYTQAIELDPENPSLYISRAQAHMKLQNYPGNVAGCSIFCSFGTQLYWILRTVMPVMGTMWTYFAGPFDGFPS
jgi:hypothetical protein